MKRKHHDRCAHTIMDHGKIAEPHVSRLIAAGYQTATRMRAATDEELLAIQGIGPGTVSKIRDWVGE